MTLFLGEMDLPRFAKTLGSPFAQFYLNGLFHLGLFQGQGVSGENQWSWTIENRIFAAVEQITPDMLARVFRATEERCDLCFDLRGHHVEMY